MPKTGLILPDTYLRRRGIRCTIPDKTHQVRNREKCGSRGGRPPKFDKVDLVAAINEWL
ncbi:hypothetical protein [Nonomuraea dietziae]|uniref:hypothetical protein n=1 Tax=Nonomuraea dietziae TaxID=65515 RepID=UPI003F4E26FD